MKCSRVRISRGPSGNIWRIAGAGFLLLTLPTVNLFIYGGEKEIEIENAERSDRLVKRGRKLRKIGDLQGSLHDLNEAVRLNPKNTAAYVQRGITRAQTYDFDGFYFDFEKVLEIEPGDITALFGRGVMHEMKNDADGAMQDFNAVLRLKPDHNMAAFKRGILKFALGLYKEAIEDFTRVIDRKPRSATVLSARGVTKMQTGDLAGALDDLNLALHVNPRLYRTSFAKGKVYLLQGYRKAALFEFDKALQINRQYADVYLLRGLVHLTLDRHPEALVDLEKTLRLYKKPVQKDDPQLLLWFTRMSLGKEEEANEELQKHFDKRLAEEKEGGAEIPPLYAARVRFQLGEVEEKSVAALTGDEIKDSRDQQLNQCSNYFYTALDILLRKDAETAIPHLQKCLQTKQFNTIEYIGADLRLRKFGVKLEKTGQLPKPSLWPAAT